MSSIEQAPDYTIVPVHIYRLYLKHRWIITSTGEVFDRITTIEISDNKERLQSLWTQFTEVAMSRIAEYLQRNGYCKALKPALKAVLSWHRFKIEDINRRKI